MATPNKTNASGATAGDAVAFASVAMVSPEDANAHRQHHFVAYPSVHSAHMDVAGHTSLHRAIYSIALQANNASSEAASSSSPPTLSSSPKQMIDWILSTTDGRRSTSVRCRRGGWTPLHLCCRLVVIPEDIILALVDCNPSAIAIRDDDGENCIHLACRYGLSEAIIERLVARSPQSAFIAKDEENGDLPLHAAIHHGASPDVLSALVSACPESVRSCNDNGQSCLHLACEYERHDFVKVAVEHMVANYRNARTIMRQISEADDLGSTPISILWSNFVESFGGSVEDPYCTWFDAGGDTKDSQEQAATWASLASLMTAAVSGGAVKTSSENGHTLLQSAIGLGADAVPASLFQYIVFRYPSALQMTNSDGQLPLHEAILASSKPRDRLYNDERNIYSVDQRDDDDQEYDDAECDDRESRTGKPESGDEEKKLQYEHSDDESLSTPSSFDEIKDVLEAMRPSPVLVVLEAYPRAASIPCGDGRLALHLAIEAQMPWDGGLSKIFGAAPTSLRVPDPKTGLLPFLHAATSGASRSPSGKKGADSVNTIFQLLRLGPDLMASTLQGDDGKQKRKASASIKQAVHKRKRARLSAPGDGCR